MILVKKINLLFQTIWINRASRKSIKKNLEYIFVFPEFKRRLIYHPKNFFFKPSKRFYDNCEYNTQKAVDEILRHCGLDNISVRVTHDPLQVSKALSTTSTVVNYNIPGTAYQLNNRQYTIYINKNYSPKIIAGILSHEIGHIYILSNDIKFKTGSSQEKRFEEQMTDLSTIALGLGKLMIEGHSYSYYEKGQTYNGIIGYLTSGILYYAQALMELKIEQVNRKIINMSKVS